MITLRLLGATPKVFTNRVFERVATLSAIFCARLPDRDVPGRDQEEVPEQERGQTAGGEDGGEAVQGRGAPELAQSGHLQDAH